MDNYLVSEEKKDLVINDTDSKKAVLFLGKSGAGKSVTLNTLANQELKVERDPYTDDCILVSTDNSKFKVGTGSRSCTKHPDFVDIDGTRYWDLPGFNDSGGAEEEEKNNDYINQICAAADSFKFVIVLNQQSFSNRFAGFIELLKILNKILGTRDPINDNFCIILTRCSSRLKFHNIKNIMINLLNENERPNEEIRPFLEYLKDCEEKFYFFRSQEEEFNSLSVRQDMMNAIEKVPFCKIRIRVPISQNLRLRLIESMKLSSEISNDSMDKLLRYLILKFKTTENYDLLLDIEESLGSIISQNEFEHFESDIENLNSIILIENDENTFEYCKTFDENFRKWSKWYLMCENDSEQIPESDFKVFKEKFVMFYPEFKKLKKLRELVAASNDSMEELLNYFILKARTIRYQDLVLIIDSVDEIISTKNFKDFKNGIEKFKCIILKEKDDSIFECYTNFDKNFCKWTKNHLSLTNGSEDILESDFAVFKEKFIIFSKKINEISTNLRDYIDWLVISINSFRSIKESVDTHILSYKKKTFITESSNIVGNLGLLSGFGTVPFITLGIVSGISSYFVENTQEKLKNEAINKINEILKKEEEKKEILKECYTIYIIQSEEYFENKFKPLEDLERNNLELVGEITRVINIGAQVGVKIGLGVGTNAAKATANVGVKVGAKVGAKVAGKVGAKVAAKAGAKVGVKAGSGIGAKASTGMYLFKYIGNSLSLFSAALSLNTILSKVNSVDELSLKLKELIEFTIKIRDEIY